MSRGWRLRAGGYGTVYGVHSGSSQISEVTGLALTGTVFQGRF